MATKTTRARATRSGSPAPAEQPATEQALPAAQPAPTPAPMPVMRLEQLDPRTLLLDGNIRSEADLDEDFVASIRQRGVVQPIVAVQTEQGVQVRYGQRRTLAVICTSR